MRQLPVVRMVSGSRRYLKPENLAVVAYALVDDWHYDYLAQFTWFFVGVGYPARGESGKIIYLHVEVAKRAGFSLSECVDHVDRNKLNAQESNLEPKTKAEDNANQGTRKDNTSGEPGVSWHKVTRKWRGQVHIGGRIILDALFTTLEEARVAVRTARKKP